MWFEKILFRNLTLILLILLIVYIGYQLLPLLESVTDLLLGILYPVVFSLILYYLFRPLVRKLQDKITIYGAIITVFCLIATFTVFAVIFIYPQIVQQVKILQSINLENVIDIKRNNILNEKAVNFGNYFIDTFKYIISQLLNNIHSIIIEHFSFLLSVVTNFVVVLAISPFILYYLLKDDEKLYNHFLSIVPARYTDSIQSYLKDIDQVLIHYINGRVIISLIINLLLLVCFLAIGINFASVLIAISFIFYIIPTIGGFIAMIPPLLVGFSQGSLMGIEALVIMSAATAVEGFIVTPLVMGKKLYIHPLTVIFVVLTAGALFGILGLLLSTPLYVICKLSYTHFQALKKKEVNFQ